MDSSALSWASSIAPNSCTSPPKAPLAKRSRNPQRMIHLTKCSCLARLGVISALFAIYKMTLWGMGKLRWPVNPTLNAYNLIFYECGCVSCFHLYIPLLISCQVIQSEEILVDIWLWLFCALLVPQAAGEGKEGSGSLVRTQDPATTKGESLLFTNLLH